MFTYCLFALSLIAVSLAAPSNVVVPADGEVKKVATAYASLGASASFGPYSAGAGLGGQGFGAGASTGTGASAGASVAGSGVKSGPGFFDAIFNIPISVLKSVNTHLNDKASAGAGAGAGAGSSGVAASASAGASSGSSSYAGAGAGLDARAGVSADGASAGAGGVSAKKNYDSTFAIPIAALTSVNQFLNGKK